MDYVQQLIDFFKCIALVIWNSTTDFIHDVTVQLFQTFLDVFIALLNIIDPAQYISFKMQDAVAVFPGNMQYFLAVLALPTCFAIIGTGYTVRVLRKFITLFQW